jgi:hypothetical protein
LRELLERLRLMRAWSERMLVRVSHDPLGDRRSWPRGTCGGLMMTLRLGGHVGCHSAPLGGREPCWSQRASWMGRTDWLMLAKPAGTATRRSIRHCS